MKRKILSTFERHSLICLASLLLMTLHFSSCSKKRPPELSEEQKETIFKKEDYHNANAVLKLGSASKLSLRKNGEAIEKFEVEEVRGPSQLARIFKGFPLIGSPGQDIPAVIMLRKDNKLSTYKLMPKKEFNHAFESEKILTSEYDDENYKIELFSYPGIKYGILEPVKNDLGETTNKLRFKETNFQNFTHFMVNFDAEKEMPAELSEDQKDSLFRISDYSNGNGENDQLGPDFILRLGNEVKVSFQEDGKYFNKYEVTGISSLRDGKPAVPSYIESLFRNFLVEGEAGQSVSSFVKIRDDFKLTAYKIVTDEELKSLSKQENSQAKKLPNGKYQIELFAYAVSKFGVLEPVKNEKGETTNKLRMRETPFEQATHFEANFEKEKILPATLNPDELKKFDREDTLWVDDYRGKEFLLRRTLIDSPNAFGPSFAGSTGRLEIVKFTFKENHLEVRRSYPILPKEATTQVDEEVLMLLPVYYFKYLDKDGQGRPLSVPKYSRAEHNEKGIFARVTWEQNSIPTISSPLSYFGVEQCFSGAKSREISDIRKVRDGKMLNFTLTTTYASSAGLECNPYRDYWRGHQTNFTFKERISFKEYSKEQSGDERPLFDVPYEIQKRMGFGLFTYEKVVPDRLGQTHLRGQRVPLPAIFDIRKDERTGQFRQVTYVLAGIPTKKEDKVLRDKLIVATKEVIKDLNEAFKKAFLGTPMERAEDVVLLNVEELSKEEEELYQLQGTEKGMMGDLDRNYIYYVQKASDNGIIGLGGSHSNPRSGKVEAASVFMYGGNIKGAVASIKLSNKARKEYRKNMTPPAPVNPAPPTPADGSNGSNGNAGENGSGPNVPIHAHSHGHSHDSPLSELRHPVLRKNLENTSALTLKSKLSADELFDRIDHVKRSIKGTRDHSMVHNPFKVQAMAKALQKAPEAQSLYLKYQKAVAENAFENPFHLEAILEGKVEDGQVIEQPKMKALATITENIRKADFCLYHHPGHESAGTELKNIENMSDEDILISIYKPTLAHELGHNFGLRHNFYASFDAINHYFSMEEKTRKLKANSPRDYSSVMDYQNTDHETYDGFGPQDIHAIRAAYAGMIPQQRNINTKLVSLEKLKQDLGLKDWNDLTKIHLEAMGIKEFKFCSDEQAGTIPGCDRFDQGTTYHEIVNNMIESYKSTYSIRNFPGERLNFSRNASSYLASVMRTFQQLANFFINSFQLNNHNDIVESLQASYQALFFFQEVVSTPDASSYHSIGNNSRFTPFPVTLPLGKTTIMVEPKWFWNLSKAGTDKEELAVRGIQLDKILALLMLTNSTSKFINEDGNNVLPNYYFLEQMLGYADSRESSSLLNLLKEVMMDDITPRATFEIIERTGHEVSVNKYSIPLKGRFKSSSSSTMQSIAKSGAAIGLHYNDARLIDEDPSSAFTILSRTLPPNGQDYVTQPNSSGREKFWADTDAPLAQELVAQGAAWDKLLRKSDDLGPLLLGFLGLNMMNAPEDKLEEHQKQLAEIKSKIDEILTQLPARALAPKGKQPLPLEEMVTIFNQIVEASQKLPIDTPDRLVNLQNRMVLEVMANNHRLLAMEYPIMGLFFSSLPPQVRNINPHFNIILPGVNFPVEMWGNYYRTAKDLSQHYYLINNHSMR